ncbi:MAG: exodeoxyribonuclease III [Firmicutes bacterium]|nr:exodeoxyribonuclease III [Bacillota bacterium]
MRFVSWNVNGFRACLNKGFADVFAAADADAFCLQETKMQPGQADFSPEGWQSYFHSAQKKGYSGTAVFCREEPLSVTTGLDGAHLDEGRVLTLEYPGYYLVTCYTPNAQDGLARIDYRMEFEDCFRDYLGRLKQDKPTVVCGDLNVAHEEIDLKNPKANRGNAGFSDQERGKFSELLASGFVDSFRLLHPDEIKYSWWSYRFRARQNNAGWRIDYFLVSEDAADRIRKAEIWNQYQGSDHCPVMLEIDL